MRKSLGLATVCLLVLGFAEARAADKDARAVIDKAIKAMGGADHLAKYKAFTWTETGTYYGMGDGLPYTGTYAVEVPGKFRMEIEGIMVLVVNGDKGWVQMGGTTKDMTRAQMKEQKEERYAEEVTWLLPLKHKGFTLTLLGESKVGGKPAVGVKVAHAGYRDVKLYFDREGGLLLKNEHPIIDEQHGNKEVNEETLFSDYGKVKGVKVPMNLIMKRGGKPFVEAKISDWKFADKLDDSLFSKP